MFRSHALGKVLGVDLRVHGTVGLLAGLLTLFALIGSGLLGAAWTLAFIAMVAVSVTLHELGHILAARRFGIQTTGITLYPFGGVANLTREARNGTEEVVVALAGPAVNLALASLTALPIALFGWFEPLSTFLGINLALAIFNLLPAYPMDGGRVLRGALWSRLGHRKATMLAARGGQAFAVVFGLLGLFTNPMLLVIAGFVFLHATAELNRLRLFARPVAPQPMPGYGQASHWSAGPQPRHPYAFRQGPASPPPPAPGPRLVHIRTPWGTFLAWES